MSTFKEKETQFLDGLFKNYITSNDSSYLRFMRESMITKCIPHIKDDAIALELGCEIGYMTSLISPLVRELDVIEGSQSFINEAKKRKLNNVIFYNMLFEELSVKNKYDCVFMSHVIEHLKNPTFVLELVMQSLKKDGVLLITIPNAKALSRQLAKSMGIIHNLYDLTSNDIRGGHRRVYDSANIHTQISKAGFRIEEVSGVLVKPFCDFQMDYLMDSNFLERAHLDGLLELGKTFPEICGDIFVCARKI